MSPGPTRRSLLALPAALVVAPPAFAQGQPFEEKIVPAAKVYPYLEAFLKVPASDRARVRVDYFVLRDGKPAAGLQSWFVGPGGARTAAPVGTDGRLLRVPNLGELRSDLKVAFNLDKSARMGVRLELGPALHPAQEMDAHELSLAVDEANRVLARAAGPMSLVAPKMAQVICVGAPGGVAVLGDGHTQPLTLLRGQAAFNPSMVRGAVRIRLARPPQRLAFAP